MCILPIRTILKHYSLQKNWNTHREKSKKKYQKNPLCFHKKTWKGCWLHKVLLFWRDFFLLSWTRTLHIGMLAFPSCQFHEFLALKSSWFHGWILNGWIDDFLNEYEQIFMNEKIKLWWNKVHPCNYSC